MEDKNNWSLQIDDFDLSDFDNPIKLLESIKKKTVVCNENYILQDDPDDTMVSLFADELLNMKTSYSYKPVLLLALLEKANVEGEALISDVVDFFINFYSYRKDRGLIVEKDDSTFAKNVSDRVSAKRTIITYPVAVFEKKKFIFFNKATGIITIEPSIWNIVTQDNRKLIKKHCSRAIEQYYCRILKEHKKL